MPPGDQADDAASTEISRRKPDGHGGAGHLGSGGRGRRLMLPLNLICVLVDRGCATNTSPDEPCCTKGPHVRMKRATSRPSDCLPSRLVGSEIETGTEGGRLRCSRSLQIGVRRTAKSYDIQPDVWTKDGLTLYHIRSPYT